MSRDYDSTFTCARGQKWRIEFRLNQILKFCSDKGKKLEDLLPNSLNESEVIELSFIGIQHHADAKGITWDMWLDDHLSDGDAYAGARDASAMGVLNFTLPRLPEKMRVLLRHTLNASLRTVAESTTSETEVKEGGLGLTSASSAPQQGNHHENVNTPSAS